MMGARPCMIRGSSSSGATRDMDMQGQENLRAESLTLLMIYLSSFLEVLGRPF